MGSEELGREAFGYFARNFNRLLNAIRTAIRVAFRSARITARLKRGVVCGFRMILNCPARHDAVARHLAS